MPHAARRRRAARPPPSSLLRSSFRRDLRGSMQHSGDTLRMSPAFFISYRTPAGSGHQPSFGLAWQRRGRQVCAKASCIEGRQQARRTRAQRQYFHGRCGHEQSHERPFFRTSSARASHSWSSGMQMGEEVRTRAIRRCCGRGQSTPHACSTAARWCFPQARALVRAPSLCCAHDSTFPCLLCGACVG